MTDSSMDPSLRARGSTQMQGSKKKRGKVPKIRRLDSQEGKKLT